MDSATVQILGTIISTLTILGIVEVRVSKLVKRLVKEYLYELRPNGGGSVKDKVDKIYELLHKEENK